MFFCSNGSFVPNQLEPGLPREGEFVHVEKVEVVIANLKDKDENNKETNRGDYKEASEGVGHTVASPIVTE